MAGRHYVIDANVLIDWWYDIYPPSVFPSVRTKLEALVSQSRIHIIAHVWDEVMKYSDGSFQDWCKSVKTQVHKNSRTTALSLIANEIRKKYPELVDPRKVSTAADPYLIAYAKQQGSILVTQETSVQEKNLRSRSHFIPDVCKEMNVEYMKFIGLMRNEKWQI